MLGVVFDCVEVFFVIEVIIMFVGLFMNCLCMEEISGMNVCECGYKFYVLGVGLL